MLRWIIGLPLAGAGVRFASAQPEIVKSAMSVFGDDDEYGGVGPAQLAVIDRTYGDVTPIYGAKDLYGPAFIAEGGRAKVSGKAMAYGKQATGRGGSISDAFRTARTPFLGLGTNQYDRLRQIGGSIERLRSPLLTISTDPAVNTPQVGKISVKADSLGSRTGTVRAVPSALDRKAFAVREKATKGLGSLIWDDHIPRSDANIRVSPGQKAMSALDNKMLNRELKALSKSVGGRPLLAEDLQNLSPKFRGRVIPTPEGAKSGKLTRKVLSGPGKDIPSFKAPGGKAILAKGLGGLGVAMDAYDAYSDFREGNYMGALGNVVDVGTNLFLPGALLNMGISTLGLEADGIGELTADVLSGETSLSDVAGAVVDKAVDAGELADAIEDAADAIWGLIS